jgi:peptidase U32
LLERCVIPLGEDIKFAENLLIDSPFKEFYTGLKNKYLNNCSISHHYTPNGSISRKDLEKLSLVAKKNNKTINVTLNIGWYSSDIKNILLEDIKFLSELDIGNIIIGNLEVYFLIKEYFEKVKCTASSLFAIKSTESADFFYNLGFDRLVFPRNIEMKDIIEISENFSKKIELEAFIYGGGCNYCEGTCHLPHIFLGDISFLNEDIKKKSPLPICKFPIKALNHPSLEMLHQGNKMCGLCYCKYFDSLGIKYFKITGRTLNSLKKIEILKKLNNIIEESSFYKCDLDSSYCLYGKRRVE